MDYLTVIAPDGAQSRFDIKEAGVKVGRSSTCDLVIQDLNVSRNHAELARRSDGLYVRDAGGKNGTFVNEERIQEPKLLHPGDRIRVGTTTLVFNGTPTSSVEFSDQPLSPGPGTTYLPAESIRTPMMGDMPVLIDGTSTPQLQAAGQATSLVTTPQTLSPAALSIFFEADKELVFHRPLDELLDKIMDLSSRAVRFERGLLMLREGGELRPRVVRVPPEEAGRPISISRTIADRVMTRHESILTSDALLDERFRAGQSVELQHIRSLMCVPLWNNREVIGLIYIDSRQRVGLFTEADLRLLTHLANVAAVKIENARLFEQVMAAEMMKQELQKAAEIQIHLLPGDGPAIPGYQLHGNSLPCRAVGGDYYDYIELSGGRYAIGLGDVAGKGLPSALLMCSFQAGLRALSEFAMAPDETLRKLNHLLCRTVPENRFVTFFYGLLDPQRHTLSCVNAGQTPPWILRANGRAERLAPSGPPLGLFEDSQYTSQTIDIGPGEIFVCYSDGISEATNPAGEEFGEDGVTSLVSRHRECSPVELVEKITSALAAHCLKDTYADDVTLVVLKRTA